MFLLRYIDKILSHRDCEKDGQARGYESLIELDFLSSKRSRHSSMISSYVPVAPHQQRRIEHKETHYLFQRRFCQRLQWILKVQVRCHSQLRKREMDYTAWILSRWLLVLLPVSSWDMINDNERSEKFRTGMVRPRRTFLAFKLVIYSIQSSSRRSWIWHVDIPG